MRGLVGACGHVKREYGPFARSWQEARWTPLCGVLLVACWVRHPTEWGGEENVVPPPPAMGRRRGGPRYAGSCWWHVGLDTPRSGVEKRMCPPARDGQEARWTPLCGVLLVACWQFIAPGAMTLPGDKLWNLAYIGIVLYLRFVG